MGEDSVDNVEQVSVPYKAVGGLFFIGFWSLIFSIMMAVVSGALFGFMILIMYSIFNMAVFFFEIRPDYKMMSVAVSERGNNE